MSNSKIVTSNQAGIHENLKQLVKKHIGSNYQKPYQQHNREAFELLLKKLKANHYASLILDSCCGTAMSSKMLAQQNPDALVVGVDQSYVRLNKQTDGHQPENCLLLRANCEDIWRLCVEQQIYFDVHYILYPNPWPKSVHLKRRWHGHPVFTCLNKLAGETILRSNWKTYLDEFAQAWLLLTQKEFNVAEFEFEKPLTLFEKKYAQSGQVLYQLCVES